MSSIDNLISRAFNAFDSGDYTLAASLYAQLLNKSEPGSEAHRFTRHMLAFTYAQAGDYPAARAMYTQLHDDAKAHADYGAISVVLHQLAMVERLAGQYEAALAYLDRERAALDQYTPDATMHYAANAYERGYIAFLKGDFATAQKIMQQSLDLATQAGDPVAKACALRGLGEIAAGQKQIKIARARFLQSRALFAAVDDSHACAEIDALIAALSSS